MSSMERTSNTVHRGITKTVIQGGSPTHISCGDWLYAAAKPKFSRDPLDTLEHYPSGDAANTDFAGLERVAEAARRCFDAWLAHYFATV